jgi:putative colanic acid biosynthesis acetyltransferase WcaF
MGYRSVTQRVNLGKYSSPLDRGASAFAEATWLIVLTLIASGVPGSSWRCALLRCFGAKIAKGVVIKPRVRVKFPWKLCIGTDSWIGEGVWIDNLCSVSIGRDCCVSQEAYLCTGSHDWSSSSFDLRLGNISIEDCVWVAAKAVVGPGSRLHVGAIIGLGAVFTGEAPAWTIWRGNPAEKVGLRSIRDGNVP